MINNIAQDLPPEVESDVSSFMKENKSSSSDFKKYLYMLVAGVVLLVAGLVAYQLVNSPLIIAFTGSGSESATASKAIISFIVSSNNADADTAVKTTRDRANAFKQLLLNNNIDSKNISISEVSVTPTTGANSTIVYQASVSISLTTSAISTLDELVSLLYTNGAVYVSQPVLTSDNETAFEQKALEKAIVEAKGKANTFANKHLKLIKKIVAIDQQTSGTTSSSTTNTGQVNASTGSFNVIKAVSVTYKMW